MPRKTTKGVKKDPQLNASKNEEKAEESQDNIPVEEELIVYTQMKNMPKLKIQTTQKSHNSM